MMHPDMAREMVRQRIAERQEKAREANVARALRKAMRRHRHAEARDTFVPPAIPDYVDGTFRETGTPCERTGAAR
jgi:hypothetical protein